MLQANTILTRINLARTGIGNLGRETIEQTLLASQSIQHCTLDGGLSESKPVSNSRRMRDLLIEAASQSGWDWQAELCQSPDAELKKINGTVVSTDSVILDSVKV